MVEGNSIRDDLKDSVVKNLEKRFNVMSLSTLYEIAADIVDEVCEVLEVSPKEQDIIRRVR